MPDAAPTIVWFRRDLRLSDHPALAAAAAQGPVTALFVLDDVLLRSNEGPRTAYLLRTLRALDADLRDHGGRLTVRRGRPQAVVPALAREIGAAAVQISADYAPYGSARDQRVAEALGGTPLVRTGSPYAVAPGRVVKGDGSPYAVFTPFYRGWVAHGWRGPADSRPEAVTWRLAEGDPIPPDPPISADLPEAGERAALQAWKRFRDNDLGTYGENRDRPDLDRTSHLSPHLKLGTIHPRTVLADLGASDGPYARQLAWRDFYAAVLHHWPHSATGDLRTQLETMAYDTGATADRHFGAWASGRTGFPIVDAGMRHMLATGWMHNRLRMIVASFLVKDLHIEWTRGARHFMDHLVDGDVANNHHGWQWTAGTGTDPAPYFRVFNPVTQGRKCDPEGDYVRSWVPELRGISGDAVHNPVRAGAAAGYPAAIVDHATERAEALARYAAVTGGGRRGSARA